MPTYEYYCPDCDQLLDIFHSMKEDARTECPQCQKTNLTRKISGGSGLIFKGSGFYETDYKKSSKEADAPKPSEAKAQQPASAGCCGGGCKHSGKVEASA